MYKRQVLPRYELSALACILHAAVSACVVVNLTAFGLLINQLDMRTAVVTALCCLTGYGVASLLFSFSLNGVPLVAMGVGYGLVLAAAYALCAKTIDPATVSYTHLAAAAGETVVVVMITSIEQLDQ